MFESEILKGCCDIHLHVAPSMIPRITDVVTVAHQAQASGYRAIVIKDHHYNSAPLCNQVKEYLFKDADLDIFGSISLNNSVGGVNPYVVQAAIGLGVKIIWMPTVSAGQHMEFHRSGGAFPTSKVALQEKPIVLLDSNGKLKPEATEVIQLIAQSPETVLATGHGDAAEITAVVEKAVELGVKNIVVDHPTFGLNATMEDVKYWASLGCWIEHCGTISDVRMGEKSTSYGEIADYIGEIGVEKTILSSDYGQVKFGHCIEGMDSFVHGLRQAGVSVDDLKTMCGTNPGKLLGIP